MVENPIGLTIAEAAEHLGVDSVVMDTITKLTRQGDFLDHITKSRIGICRKGAYGSFVFNSREILLSQYPRQSTDAASSTFLHEYAHLLDFWTRRVTDHSKHWKEWARAVGTRPTATDPTIDPVWEKARGLKPIGVCLTCGQFFEALRRFDMSGRTHKRCGGRVTNVFPNHTVAGKFPHYGDYTLVPE